MIPVLPAPDCLELLEGTRCGQRLAFGGCEWLDAGGWIIQLEPDNAAFFVPLGINGEGTTWKAPMPFP